MIRNAFSISEPLGTMRRNSCQDIGHSLDLEVKRSGMVLVCQSPNGQWNSVAAQMLQRFLETGHPTCTGTSALSRGFLKGKKNKDTSHITAESSNAELLFRIIHSSNQLSVYGAVSSWSGQPSLGGAEPISERFVESEESVNAETLKSVNSQEESSLVDSARSWYASGNSARDNLQDMKLMDIPHWIAIICELAAFWNLVEKGKYCRTHPDMDDGFGGVTLACREYAPPRQEKGSTVLGVKPEGTVIGASPTLCCYEDYGNLWN